MSIPWHGRDGGPRKALGKPHQLDLSPSPPGCSRAEQHRARGAPFLPKNPSAEKEHQDESHVPTGPGHGWFEGSWPPQHQGGCFAPRSWQRGQWQHSQISPFSWLAFLF